jgi:hypothetical protein
MTMMVLGLLFVRFLGRFGFGNGEFGNVEERFERSDGELIVVGVVFFFIV